MKECEDNTLASQGRQLVSQRAVNTSTMIYASGTDLYSNFGVLAQLVSQRTHEIGLGMALGASRHQVFQLVVGRGLFMTVVGLGVGIVSGTALTRFFAALLFGLKSSDPFTFTAVSLLLCSAALLACYVPASRAMRIDPMVALRNE